MKRSSHIEIGFLSIVAAAALSGCSSYHRDWEHCVDQRNVVVEDRLCDNYGQSSTPYFYHRLYSPHPYYPGEVVIGGYPAPRPNMSVARASSASFISRGGFGSSAHGGGGGE